LRGAEFALERADRSGVDLVVLDAVGAARMTRDRGSVLVRYALDGRGLTTREADGRLAVDRGELVWGRGQ
jgi:hypothetical protein